MAVSLDTPSYAIIDGALCRVNRRGAVVKRHPPMGVAVEEFVATGASTLVVRENAHGFLLGMPNLYCVDENLKMLWLAELPSPEDTYIGALQIETDMISCASKQGRQCRLSLSSGKLLP